MTELRQRQPRVRDKGFLAFVRTKPCCICGATGRTQAAHIRYGDPARGESSTGMAQKPNDRRAVPMCGPLLGAMPPIKGCHFEQHGQNERAFWERKGLDPFVIAARLSAEYGASRPETGRGERKLRRPRKAEARQKRATARRQPGPKRKIQSRGFDKGHRPFRRTP